MYALVLVLVVEQVDLDDGVRGRQLQVAEDLVAKAAQFVEERCVRLERRCRCRRRTARRGEPRPCRATAAGRWSRPAGRRRRVLNRLSQPVSDRSGADRRLRPTGNRPARRLSVMPTSFDRRAEPGRLLYLARLSTASPVPARRRRCFRPRTPADLTGAHASGRFRDAFLRTLSRVARSIWLHHSFHPPEPRRPHKR